MTHPRFPFAWPAAAAAAFAFAGCNDQPGEKGGGATATGENPPVTAHDDHGEGGHAAHDESAHAHPEHGPHKGELIELGEEEYHAEITHEATKVTVYLLDSAAKAAVPIEEKEVTINLTHDGKPEQFALKASPESGDPEGKSSRFVSDDAELAEDLSRSREARLAVTIAGTPYVGKVSHDHGGHAH